MSPAGATHDEESVSNEAWLAKWPAVHGQHRKLVAQLYHGEVTGARASALETVALVRSIVGTCRWKTAAELLGRLRWLGTTLVEAAPQQLSVGNVLRRVSLFVREEYSRLSAAGSVEGPSLGDFGAEDTVSLDQVVPELRQNVMEQILELYDDVETADEPIAAQGPQHVHDNDVVMTLGNADDVFAFLSTARRKSAAPAEIIVVETAPSKDGLRLAARLGPSAVVVPESAVFALMSRVHKVILPTHAVLADGSLLTPAAGLLVALAARHFAVPLLCLAALYKLAPIYPHDPDHFAHHRAPNDVLPYALIPATPLDNSPTFVLNPSFDLLPPHLVDLYITNTGPHQPSYVYRLLAELYSHHDHHLV